MKTLDVLKLFKTVSETVPAYRRFLKSKKTKVKSIISLKNFKNIPLADKKNYLWAYALSDLVPSGKFPPMVYASSGSSGKPTFWFRGDEHEKSGGYIHEQIFRGIFGIKKNDPTLVVICFSMGVWVAGNYTLASCRQLARDGYNITIISPGMEKEDIFSAFKSLAPLYKNLVIAGYPPFVMDVINESMTRGIKLGGNVKILTAGDKFTEDWRDNIMDFLKIKDPFSIVSIYGSADAAILGHETPISIFIRRSVLQHPGIYKELFGDEANLPALVQYDPSRIFFEEVNGELVITTKTAIPLVRYNIHDIGSIIYFDEMVSILKSQGLLGEAEKRGINDWRLPFLVLKGRTDVALTFYAINIYPEHIKTVLDDKNIVNSLTGSYIAYNSTTKDGKEQKFHLELELADKINVPEELLLDIKNCFVKKLSEVNIEYRKLYSVIGSRAIPTIELKSFGELKSQITTGPSIVSRKGKKPKMVI